MDSRRPRPDRRGRARPVVVHVGVAELEAVTVLVDTVAGYIERAGRATRVAVVAFDGISPFHLSVPCIVFGEDRTAVGDPRFDLTVCAVQPGTLQTNAGFAITVAHGLGVLRHADVVVVPSWCDDLRPAPPALLRALQAAHRRGAVIVGLCLGAFVLAEAGLLDGRPATTHWKLAPEFARRYPRVALQAEVLYVEDGLILTSAGTAAGIDCCLHLLRVRCGAEAANRAARRMVVAPHRTGGQDHGVPHRHPVGGTLGLDLEAAVHHRPLRRS